MVRITLSGYAQGAQKGLYRDSPGGVSRYQEHRIFSKNSVEYLALKVE